MKLTLPPTPDHPRIVLFGIDCHFTRLVLEGLLAGGAYIAGMILPGPPGVLQPLPVHRARTSIPLAGRSGSSRGVGDILTEHEIPAYRLGDLRSASAVKTMASFNVNVLVCACFPRIIPRDLTHLFPQRAVNIHPSLLPDKRGPDPLFWTFREGSGRSGVSIHDLSARFDSGAVLAQRAYTYRDGTTERELETSLAAMAVEMMLALLERLATGTVQRHDQHESAATYAPWPEPKDYRLEPSMSARAAYNFVRGVEARGEAITVEHSGCIMTVVEAIGFTTHPTGDQSGVVPLEFIDGCLLARLRPSDK